MKRGGFLRRWCAAWLLVSSFGAAVAEPEPCKLQQMDMPVRLVGDRAVATITLNGIEVPMMVDSGAFFSVLNPSAAEQLKLSLRSLPPGYRIEGVTGRVEARMTRVARVGLLGTELTDVDFIVGGNEFGAGTMGILGRNILSAGDAEYDLAHGLIHLSFPKGDCDDTNFAHWAGNAPVVVVPLRSAWSRNDTAIRVNVDVNGKRLQAVMDTGAPQTTLALRAAHRAGIEDSELTLVGRSGGAGEGRANLWIGPVKRFEVGGEKIENNRLFVNDVSDADHDLLLGMDYFLSHRVYVSRLQGKVYITWNGTAPFALARRGSGRYDPQYAARPEEASKDDADALARRGAAALAAGDFATALKDLDRACELAPGVADYFFDRARVRLAMRQPRLALPDLDRALEIGPELTAPRMRRASVRAQLGARAGAMDDLAQLDAGAPPSIDLRAEMAQLYARFDLVEPAMKQYQLWLDSHRKDARRAAVLNERCWLRARLNIDVPLAVKDCEEAVDIDEGEAAYRDSLGWAWLRLADAPKARRAFDQSIKLRPLPFSLYGRALAEKRLNDPAAADDDLAAARKMMPTIDADVRRAGFEFGEAAGSPARPGS